MLAGELSVSWEREIATCLEAVLPLGAGESRIDLGRLARIEAHRPAGHRVVTAHPKIIADDPGLATWASRAWDPNTAPDADTTVALTETVVGHAIASLADASADQVVLCHWHDKRSKREVDHVMCHPGGRFVPIEAKASTSISPRDTTGLRAFIAEVPTKTHQALAIYEGDQIVDLTPPVNGPPIFGLPRTLL